MKGLLLFEGHNLQKLIAASFPLVLSEIWENVMMEVIRNRKIPLTKIVYELH